MPRQPVVADRFYPGNPAMLRQALQGMIPCAETITEALAVVAPHAGYVYSGAVAGEVFAKVRIPRIAVILGPNHHGRGRPLAVASQDWLTPLGLAPLNRNLANTLLEQSTLFTRDDTAHASEHSLEVQVPFLQYLQPNLTIVPIVVSHLSYSICQRAAKELATAVRACGEPVLLVASSDMTHYESRRSATRKDRPALDHILRMNPQGLYDYVVGERVTMCGIMPVTIALLAAMDLGATKAELVRYTDSGEVSGDTEQVVGYAGLLIR